MSKKPSPMTSAQRERLMELGRASRDLLNNEAFDKVVTHLLSEQLRRFQECEVGSLTATTAHATIRALNDIKSSLRSLAENLTIEEKKANV